MNERAAANEATGTPHGMKRNDHYSAASVRRRFDLTAGQVEKTKRGGVDLEGIIWCPACRTFFDGDLFAAVFIFNGLIELGCAECADGLGRVDDDGPASIHRPACGDHALGAQPERCAACFFALAHYKP